MLKFEIVSNEAIQLEAGEQVKYPTSFGCCEMILFLEK